jgi:hypothetical protein
MVPKKGGKCKNIHVLKSFPEVCRASFGARRFFRGFLMQIFPTVNFSEKFYKNVGRDPE